MNVNLFNLFYFKIAIAAIMLLFIPCLTFTYIFLRQRLRVSEDMRRLRALNLEEQYIELSEFGTKLGFVFRMHMLLALLFLSIVIMAGLVVLLFPNDFGFEKPASFKLTEQSLKNIEKTGLSAEIQSKLKSLENKAFDTEDEFLKAVEEVIYNDQLVRYETLILLFAKFSDAASAAPKFLSTGPWLVAGMGFLGAYLWGLQDLIRRYFMNDLLPGLYYRIGLRILLASTLALLISNAYNASPIATGGSNIDAALWPAVAFLIGMFPIRGLQWLMGRIPLFSPRPDPSVRDLPLEMIEGISNYDKIRLEELGIDDCHDLADEDFVPLIIRTPYGARKLINWLLQAKLCVHVGYEVRILREHNIRHITDVKALGAEDLEQLIAQTTLTKESMRRAKKAIDDDQEIDRLLEAGSLLSKYRRETSATSGG